MLLFAPGIRKPSYDTVTVRAHAEYRTLENMNLPFHPPVLHTCSSDVVVWKPKNLLGS